MRDFEKSEANPMQDRGRVEGFVVPVEAIGLCEAGKPGKDQELGTSTQAPCCNLRFIRRS